MGAQPLGGETEASVPPRIPGTVTVAARLQLLSPPTQRDRGGDRVKRKERERDCRERELVSPEQ